MILKIENMIPQRYFRLIVSPLCVPRIPRNAWSLFFFAMETNLWAIFEKQWLLDPPFGSLLSEDDGDANILSFLEGKIRS